MLLVLHEKYTISALHKFDGINEEIANEILKGSFVNDLCELTNEYTKVNNILKKYMKVQREKGLLDHIPFYQSHWGKLSALHCMANINNESPEITHSNILNWLEFLEFLVFNIDQTTLEKRINEFEDILGTHVSELKFRLSHFLDTDNIIEAKYRVIGMIVHIIQDSYTVSHCKREGSDIMAFYCYSEQSKSEHKKYDRVLAEHEEKMLSDINDVLSQLLNEKTAIHLYKEILSLSSLAVPSSSGSFV